MKNLDSIFSLFLSDNASQARELGVEKLGQICTEFKADWVINVLIPKLKDIYDQPKQGYLFRMTVFNTFTAIMPVLSKDQIITYISPILLKAFKDVVPNVRFCALKLIKKVSKFIDPQLLAKQYRQ